jgi:hypothetical protein
MIRATKFQRSKQLGVADLDDAHEMWPHTATRPGSARRTPPAYALKAPVMLEQALLSRNRPPRWTSSADES